MGREIVHNNTNGCRSKNRSSTNAACPSPLSIHLGQTKTSSASEDEVVYLTSRPVGTLNAWLRASKIEAAAAAGLESQDFSAHGLRSGHLTEAANGGIPLPEAMEQSRHRSMQQAAGYYNSATRRNGRAVRLLPWSDRWSFGVKRS